MFSRSPRRPAASRLPLRLESLETRETPAATVFATGSAAGVSDVVTVYDVATSHQKYTITPFGGTFTGGVRVAVADLNGDGNQEIIVAPGAGGGSVVNIYNAADGTLIRSLTVGDANSRAGVGLATTDLGLKGASDLVVGAVVGGTATVEILKADGTKVRSFTPFAGFGGGLSVATGDVNKDGIPDIAVGAGPGGAPRVTVFDGTTNAVLFDKLVFETSFNGGVTVTAGDLNGDGRAEVVVSAGPLGGPRLEGFDPANNFGVMLNFFAFDQAQRQGAQVSLFDTQKSGKLDLVAVSGQGGGLAAFDGRTFTSITPPNIAGLPTITLFSPVPTIVAVSPASGPLAGGTTVTITGTNFTGATGVKFGTVAATSFTVNSATSITATVPAGTAGVVDVSVTTAAGTTTTSTTDQFTYQTAPTVTAVNPASGPLAGGTTVTITGTNFTGATGVKFGTVAATSFTVNSATSITVTVPAGAAGPVDVTVTTSSGTSATSAADQFTYTTAPTVTAIAPAAGPLAGGTAVTITGTNFTGATGVKFGAVAATTFTVNSPTSITAVAPAGAAAAVDVTVTTPTGTSATSAADLFTYQVAPTVTAVSPATGPTVGGTSVTITGTSFTNATAVKFGTVAAMSFTVNSATSITAVIPAGAAGAVDITVTTPGGTSAASAADRFTYAVVLAVGGVAPNAGPLAGGTSVTITGTNFTGATSVKFGSVAATSFTVNSPTSITAVAPAGAAGVVDITVTTPTGTSPVSVNDQFTYAAVPAVTAIIPSAGPLAGGTTVTISGTALSGATAVKFGAVAATSFTVNSATSITAVVPAGAAGAVDITVTTPGGTSATSANDQFTYEAAPTITALSPASGAQAGGTSVTITGTNFTGATSVKFGSVAAISFTINSATQITAVAPAGTIGVAVDVTVTTPSGTSAISAADQFTFVAAPTVTAVGPTAGPLAGGTTVTITGTGFTAATAVKFGAVAAT
ncbi:MAG: hypothetical protein JWO38_7839, partial [Gemmataceae bacterium]|nr:hypothetical protein [Gemmataceae bacterium]